MRAIGLAVVCTALLLSTGGVAYRTLADSESAGPTADQVNPADQDLQAAQCALDPSAAAPVPHRRQIRVSEQAKEPRTHTVPLNRRGFNYRTQGVQEPEVFVKATPDAPTPRDAVPSEPASPDRSSADPGASPSPE